MVINRGLRSEIILKIQKFKLALLVLIWMLNMWMDWLILTDFFLNFFVVDRIKVFESGLKLMIVTSIFFRQIILWEAALYKVTLGWSNDRQHWFPTANLALINHKRSRIASNWRSGHSGIITLATFLDYFIQLVCVYVSGGPLLRYKLGSLFFL